MFALINSLTLHYQIDGHPRGKPLIFINSLGCDLRIWDNVIQPFTGQFQIIRYDTRGHGLSDTPPGPYTLRDHADDLTGLLNHLGFETALLVGISVGGLIAMDFALQHPARVRALVLCDTAPKIGTTEGWQDRIKAVREKGLAEMAETIVGRWFAPSFAQSRPADYRRYLNLLAHASAAGYLATCAALATADLRDSIYVITAPTLVVCGAEDSVVSPAQSREWAASLPNARVEAIDGAAHLPCIEQPAAMANAIRQFIRGNNHA